MPLKCLYYSKFCKCSYIEFVSEVRYSVNRSVFIPIHTYAYTYQKLPFPLNDLPKLTVMFSG